MRTKHGVRDSSPRVESLEERLLLSNAPKQASGGSTSHKSTYVAKLTTSAVVLPLDMNSYQIEGGGGAALYPLPPSSDHATGKVTFAIHGNEIKVTGALAHISNVSAVTIHDRNDPAVFPLRGSTTSPATQPPALNPGLPPLAANTMTVLSPIATPNPTVNPNPPAGAASEVDVTTTQYASASTTVPSPITTTTTTKNVTYKLANGTNQVVMEPTVKVMPTPAGAMNTPSPPTGSGANPLNYAANTVNAATLSDQSTQPGQIMSSNIGQTVETLLNPGNGGGPLPTAATFQTVIRPQYLQGPLSNRQGYAQFLSDLRAGYLYVLVQTNNGYDAATGATVDGDFPNGELRGTIS